MSLKSQPVKKQKRTTGQAGKAVAAGVLFAAAEELLASKSVVEAQLLPDLSDAPEAEAEADAAPRSAAETVAVDVPLGNPHAAAPDVPAASAELAELLAQLAAEDGAALATPLEEPVLLADAGAAAGESGEVVAQAPEAAPAPAPAPAGAGAEAAAPAAETAAPFSVPLAVVGGLGVFGVAADMGGGGGSRPVVTPAPMQDVNGRVIDGPVAGARVFYDTDGDGVWDQGELFAFTNADGEFTIPGITLTAQGRLVVEAGGTDTETGNTVGVLMAPLLSNGGDNLVVSPLSLVLALNPTLTQAELKAALGLPADVDLLTFDPFAAMEGEDATQAGLGVQVFAAQQQLYALVRALTEVAAGSDNQLTFNELQAALTAVGQALENGGTRDEVIAAAVTNLASNPAVELTDSQATQITQAIQDSTEAIEQAYTATSPSGLNLASARALVEAGNPNAANFAEAVALLASARAAASVSQTALLDVVDNVSSGQGSYTEGGLQDAIDDETEEYTEDIADDVAPPPPVDVGNLTANHVSTVLAAGDGGNAALDAIVAQLHSAGVERIGVDDSQVTALAGSPNDLSFAPGTDLVVTGTSFLGAAVGGDDVSQLLGAADVAVALDDSAMAAVLQGDHALDSVVQRLQEAGMDRLQLTTDQVNQLALDSDNLNFNAGTQVDVTSAIATSGTGKASAEQVSSLLGNADVTVHLNQSDVLRVQWGGNEALDNLVSTLQQAGMDTLALDASQVAALARDGNHIAAGTDVLVTGTSFLGAAGVGGDAVTQLLGAADVAVALTDAEVGAVAGRSDASLDDLVQKLQSAGMDTLQLDAAQVNTLAQAAADLSLEAGTEVTITSEFASGTDRVEDLATLLGSAEVTVQLSQQDVAAVVAGGNEALATMVDGLQQAGMDVLALDQHEVAAMAHAGLHLAAGTDVSVTGTHFLGTATNAELTPLLDAANVTVHLTGTDLGQILAGSTTDEHLDALTTHLSEVGVDALALDAGQALALANAAQDFSFNEVLDIRLDNALTLTQTATRQELDDLGRLLGQADVTAELDLADLRQLHLNSTEALGTTVKAMEGKLATMGVDSLEISDELADALAEAGVRFTPGAGDQPIVGSTFQGQEVVVHAQEDIPGDDAALLQASLLELQQLGVDRVVAAGGVTDIGLSLGGQNGGQPGFDLYDLPTFEEAANVHLVVTESDLAALLSSDGFNTLHAANIDHLVVQGSEELGTSLNELYGQALSASGLSLDAVQLTDAEVQLLGLGAEPANPLDPFNKHPQT